MLRRLLVLFIAMSFLACAAKEPAKPNKQQNTRAMQSQSDAAFNELETGKPPANAPSESGRSDRYNASIKAANEAQKELDCSIEGNCPGAVQDKPRPVETPKAEEAQSTSVAVADKPRPGSQLSESMAPGKYSKYPVINGYPVWFSSPIYDGYLGGVGVAKASNDYPVQRRTAVALAQADLARSIKIDINHEVVIERASADTRTQNYYQEKFSTMSRQQVNEFVSNTTVMDEWVNPKTGELYIWVVIPK